MWVTIGSGEGTGLSVRVEGGRFVIGSGEECQLMVRGEGIEPLHAYFEVHDDGRVELHDLGSLIGTYVDGERVESATVRVVTEVEAVEVVPARERRRLLRLTREALAAAIAAAAMAALV